MPIFAAKLPDMKIYIFYIFMTLLMSVLSVDAQVLNIERERIKTDTIGWSGTGKLSLNLVSNTKKFTEAGLGLHVQYKTLRSLYLALSDYELIKSTEDDFSNKGMQHLRYNYRLNKTITLEAFAQAQFNKVLGLDFRGLVGTGPRFKIVGAEHIRIYAATAYMHEYEEPAGNLKTERNHRLSSYLSLTLRLNDNLALINTSYYQPRFGHFKDYRLSHNLDLLMKISNHISYSLALEHLTDSRPIPGIPGKVYSIKNRLVFDFGR